MSYNKSYREELEHVRFEIASSTYRIEYAQLEVGIFIFRGTGTGLIEVPSAAATGLRCAEGRTTAHTKWPKNGRARRGSA